MGEVFFVERTFWPLNTTLYVRDFKGNDPKFVYYLLRSLDFSAFSDKSSVPGLNRNHLHELPITISADVSEQRAIAQVLGTLDDKIELNRRMNRTLEELARALFTSWFVAFDPVRAKAAGRQPAGMDAATAALFPSGFEPSAAGSIPEGWSLGSLGGEFDITMGQSPPGNTYNQLGDGLPFYQGRADFGPRFPTRRVFCTAPTRRADPGDTLVSVRAPVGDINMASGVCAIGRGLAAICHRSGSSSYTYYALQHLNPMLQKFNSEGTVFGSISTQDLRRVAIIVPPAEIVACFDALVSSMDRLVEHNESERNLLSQSRDALLPKLLSGELLIADDESMSAELSDRQAE